MINTPEAVVTSHLVETLLQTVSFPVVTLKLEALRHNVTTMASFAAGAGVLLAPHVKSHMIPAVMTMQQQHGAWGLTAANVTQARVAADTGARRILIANEVVNPLDIHWLSNALRDGLEVSCLVDSPDGVGVLDDQLTGTGCSFTTPLDVLIELGSTPGRAGARTQHTALAAAHAVARSRGLRLRGVETYEGLVAHDGTPESIRRVDQQLQQLVTLMQRLIKDGLVVTEPTALLSAGGSRFADRVVHAAQTLLNRDDVAVLLRPGTYVTYGVPGPDAVFAAALRGDTGGLRGGLTVWAQVISRPEPGLAILAVGKRNVGDRLQGLHPRHLVRARTARQPILRAGSLTGLDDQHAYLSIDRDSDVAVGDVIGIAVSHPWSLDQWRFVHVWDDSGTVVAAWPTAF